MKDLRSTTGNSLEDNALAVQQRIQATGFNYSMHEKWNVSICDLCGSDKTQWELYSHRDRYGLPVRSMRCKKCGLIFITPRMTNDEYYTFYSQWYRKLVQAFSNQTEDRDVQNRAYGLEADITLKFLGEHLPQDLQIKRMLDVGGSTGIFASKVKNTTGCETVVVEPNKAEIKQAADKGLTTCCMSFADYNTDTRFELISLLRTIEHLDSVECALRKISKLLTLNGVFLLDIVNHEWLVKMFHNRMLCTKIDHIYQLTYDVVMKYLRMFFLDNKYDIVHSDKDERYILFLVKPKC